MCVKNWQLSTEDFQPVTAYQVSMKGLECLEQMPASLRDDVHSFVFPPAPHPHELLQVVFDPRNGEGEEEGDDGDSKAGDAKSAGGDDDDDDGPVFLLVSGQYKIVSGVTEAEDVSYVSSPYLPAVRRPVPASWTTPSAPHRLLVCVCVCVCMCVCVSCNLNPNA